MFGGTVICKVPFTAATLVRMLNQLVRSGRGLDYPRLVRGSGGIQDEGASDTARKLPGGEIGRGQIGVNGGDHGITRGHGKRVVMEVPLLIPAPFHWANSLPAGGGIALMLKMAPAPKLPPPLPLLTVRL